MGKMMYGLFVAKNHLNAGSMDKDYIATYTVGINAGINMMYKDPWEYSSYTSYEYYDYFAVNYDDNYNDEWYNNFKEYQEKHNLYCSDMVKGNFNNCHRKRKR